MIPPEYRIKIKKNWFVIATIGILLGIVGFTIWIHVLFSPLTFHTTISNDLRMQLLDLGLIFTVGGGSIFAIGVYVIGDKPI